MYVYELNLVQSGDVAKWNTAATKASANETAIGGLDARVGANETAIGTLNGEMDAVEGRATAVENRATALETLVGDGYQEIAEQDIRNLFA